MAMTKKKKQSKVIVRMEDPKAKAKPDLSYGGSTLSVLVDEDTDGYPLKLTVTTVVDLPEATEKKRLDQDLLAAARITGESAKYLSDREQFFKEQIRIRMAAKGVKIEPGFLTPEASPQNKKDWEWKEFAIETLAKLIRTQEKVSRKRARVLAEAKANGLYSKAKIKDTKDSISVKGVKLDE